MMATTPLRPPVHKNRIVFHGFLLTAAQHINRTVICRTTGMEEALFLFFFSFPGACKEKAGCYLLFTCQGKQYIIL